MSNESNEAKAARCVKRLEKAAERWQGGVVRDEFRFQKEVFAALADMDPSIDWRPVVKFQANDPDMAKDTFSVRFVWDSEDPLPAWIVDGLQGVVVSVTRAEDAAPVASAEVELLPGEQAVLNVLAQLPGGAQLDSTIWLLNQVYYTLYSELPAAMADNFIAQIQKAHKTVLPAEGQD